MPGGYAYGWTGAVWTKLLCNDAGELLLDSAAIFEDTPTDGELEKGPTSNWAFDHDADADAHHVKYTDANARAAINNIFGSDGKADENINLAFHQLTNIDRFILRNELDSTLTTTLIKGGTDHDLFVYGYETGVGVQDTNFYLSDGTDYQRVVREDQFQAELALYLEEAPTNGVVNKAPTSNWAFDHDADANAHHTPPVAGDFNHQDLANRSADDHHAKYTNAEAIAAAAVYEDNPTNGLTTKAPTSNWAFDHNANVSAHHAKYTDGEARTACKLNSYLYWSLPGHGFLTEQADIDNVSRHSNGYLKIDLGVVAVRAPVHLPHNATVEEVIVHGNAGTEDEPWILRRLTLGDLSTDDMATANCNTADTTISNALIDNSLYNYYIIVNNSNTNDLFYGATIKYTVWRV